MRFLIVALCLLSWPAAVSSQDSRPPPAVAMERLLGDIREAREAAKVSMDPRTRERLDLLLSRAEITARDVQLAITAPAQLPRPVPMTADQFNRFMTALAANSFDDRRLLTLKTLGPARLTAAQGKQILQKFAFDKGREEAAVLIHPALVDPQLFSVVLEAMAFEKSRIAVMKRIAP